MRNPATCFRCKGKGQVEEGRGLPSPNPMGDTHPGIQYCCPSCRGTGRTPKPPDKETTTMTLDDLNRLASQTMTSVTALSHLFYVLLKASKDVVTHHADFENMTDVAAAAMRNMRDTIRIIEELEIDFREESQ